MASFSARGGPWEDSGASWQQSWFQERACEGFTGLVGSCGDLSVELAASEECELLEVQDKTEWENLQLAVNKDWVLTRAVKIGDVKVPPGATLCPDRASLAITDDQCSPDWALPAFDSIRKPAAVAFFRTPRLGEADKGTCLRYLIKQASLQADVGRNLHLVDLTGQSLGSDFVTSLCDSLGTHKQSLSQLLLGGNRLDDRAAESIAQFVGPPLRQLALESNRITEDGAWRLAESAVLKELCALDLTFNIIPCPQRVLNHFREQSPKMNLNIGPAWCKEEAERCVVSNKRWRAYMHAPMELLTERLECWYKSRLEAKVWECPLGCKRGRVNPAMGVQRCKDITFCSIACSHFRGKAHRKKVAAGVAASVRGDPRAGGAR